MFSRPQNGDGGHSEADLPGEWHCAGSVPWHEHQLHEGHPHGGRVLLHIRVDQTAAGFGHRAQHQGRITLTTADGTTSKTSLIEFKKKLYCAT